MNGWWGRVGSQRQVKTYIRSVGLAMSPRSASHIGSNMLRGPKRHLTTTGVNFRTMPSM